ncbi:ROK family protein [Microbacteriaceae bacterium VKM Ac-2855]|nr:ROK family protein [Microbacteriaceae bacterium VKM Ac-2855]
MTRESSRGGPTGSPNVIRQLNATEVLRHAWNGTVFTANDLIAATGLTRSTVIGVCDELVDRGWLEELENQRAAGEYSKGRPARRYALHSSAAAVVGVDAGIHRVTVYVSDLRGEKIAERSLPVDHATISAERRLDEIDGAILATLRDAGIRTDDVLAAAVGVPAPVNTAGFSPSGDGGFWARMNPPLQERFAARGWTTLVDNDANLAALAEGWTGAGAGVASYLALLSGERLGAGVVVDGALLRGVHGRVGEMRFLDLLVGVGSADGIALLARRWAADGLRRVDRARSALDRVPLESLSAPEVFAASAAGDPLAREVIERIGERMTVVFAALADVLDVELIILAGATAAAAGQVLARAERELPALAHEPVPKLRASTLGETVVAVGAVRRALSWVQEHALELALPTPDVRSAG